MAIAISSIITGLIILLLVNLFLSVMKYLVKLINTRRFGPAKNEDLVDIKEINDEIDYTFFTIRKIINIIGILILVMMFAIDPFDDFGKQVDVGSEVSKIEAKNAVVVSKEEVVKKKIELEKEVQKNRVEKIDEEKAKNIVDFKNFLNETN